MNQSKHFGLVGGLGVGATVIYYQGIAAACAERNIVASLDDGKCPRADGLGASCRLAASRAWRPIWRVSCASSPLQGPSFFAIPAITPHICLADLQRQVTAAHRRYSPGHGASACATGGCRALPCSARGSPSIAHLFGALDGLRRCSSAAMPRWTRSIASIWHWRPKGRLPPTMRRGCGSWRTLLCRRERVEAIVLAGTDLNLVFNEANAGFPAVDCAAAHIDAIVARMSS